MLLHDRPPEQRALEPELSRRARIAGTIFFGALCVVSAVIATVWHDGVDPLDRVYAAGLALLFGWAALSSARGRDPGL